MHSSRRGALSNILGLLLVMLVCRVSVCNAQASPAPSDLAGTWIGVWSNPDPPNTVGMAKLDVTHDASSAVMEQVIVVKDYDSKIYTLYHRRGSMNLTQNQGQGAGQETGYSAISVVWKAVSFRKDTEPESPIYPKDSWGTLANQILVLSIQWPDGAFDKITFYKAIGPNGLNLAKQALEALDAYIATTRAVFIAQSDLAGELSREANDWRWGPNADQSNYNDAIRDEQKARKESNTALNLDALAKQYRLIWSGLIN
jgi:hypothetical protein